MMTILKLFHPKFWQLKIYDNYKTANMLQREATRGKRWNEATPTSTGKSAILKCKDTHTP